MRTGRRSTSRLIWLVLIGLAVLYVGNIALGYWQASRLNLTPLKPSAFTVLGFPSQEMEERRWRIIITHEVPKVVQQLRETRGFARPDFYPDDPTREAPEDFKRVPVEEVVQVCPVILTEAHIEKVWVETREAETLRAQPRFSVVHLRLTKEGRARLWHYARQRVARFRALGERPRDERLLVLIGDQFWAAPIIRSEVASSWWLASRFTFLQSSDVQIQPIFDESIAEIIAKGFEEAKQKAVAKASPQEASK